MTSYYERNREKVKAKAKERYWKKREEIRAKQAAYREKHPNLNKRYLPELAMGGVDVVPTYVQSAGHDVVLREILDLCHWDEVVIKSAISASGFGTWRTSRAAAEDDQDRFVDQVRSRDVLIQPYMPEVAVTGEWSLIFFSGRYSHAVLKKPATGDFRVQRHFEELESGMHVWVCDVPADMNVLVLLRRLQEDIPPCRFKQAAINSQTRPQYLIDCP